MISSNSCLWLGDIVSHKRKINSASRMNKDIIVFLRKESLIKALGEWDLGRGYFCTENTLVCTISNSPPAMPNETITKELTRFL